MSVIYISIGAKNVLLIQSITTQADFYIKLELLSIILEKINYDIIVTKTERKSLRFLWLWFELTFIDGLIFFIVGETISNITLTYQRGN